MPSFPDVNVPDDYEPPDASIPAGWKNWDEYNASKRAWVEAAYLRYKRQVSNIQAIIDDEDTHFWNPQIDEYCIPVSVLKDALERKSE